MKSGLAAFMAEVKQRFNEVPAPVEAAFGELTLVDGTIVVFDGKTELLNLSNRKPHPLKRLKWKTNLHRWNNLTLCVPPMKRWQRKLPPLKLPLLMCWAKLKRLSLYLRSSQQLHLSRLKSQSVQ